LATIRRASAPQGIFEFFWHVSGVEWRRTTTVEVGMKEKNLSKREKNGNFFEKFEDHCKRTEF